MTTMRTRTAILRSFKDQSTGELGLGVEGADFADEAMNAATDGLLIAHDLLEHVNGISNIGPIADELEAMGGLWFVRGQHGELTRDGSGSMWTAHQNVGFDIVRMFRDWFYSSDRPTLPTPRTVATEHEQDFADILDFAKCSLLGEIDSEDREEARALRQEYLLACRALMRVGYRKACRRFKGDAATANSLFWLIADAVTPHARHCEFEGQTFVLTFGVRDGWRAFADCKEQSEECE